MNYSLKRKRMIQEQLIPRGISNRAVLEAMQNVPRHRFVPEGFQDKAYSDGALPIQEGQTISQPYIVALMIEALNPQHSHYVLDIGTGSGYAAAVLSHIVTRVYTVEYYEVLAQQARILFAELNYSNIKVSTGDGSGGWSEKAPFDGIIVSACAPEIPAELIEQLTPEGRLVIPVGERNGLQKLLCLKRNLGKKDKIEDLGMVRFVPLLGKNGFK